MRKLEPKPLGWLETERGNYIVGAGPTSQIYMRRMLDDDVNYEGIAGLNRPFLTTSINKLPDLRDGWRALDALCL
jgi:hypothetical protein